MILIVLEVATKGELARPTRLQAQLSGVSTLTHHDSSIGGGCSEPLVVDRECHT